MSQGQGPPLPHRSDSLPGYQNTPPIPPKPNSDCEAKASIKSGHLKKMATLEQLNVDSSVNQEFESKNHYRNGFKTFYNYYQKGQLCDIEIKVGEKSFACHRVILSSVSNYFQTMFMSEMAESKQKEVTIHDIDEGAMGKLVQYAYTSKIQLTTENVQPILYAASILQIEVVAKACCEFMKKHLHPSNCIGVHNFAHLHNRTELIQMADDYILENFLEVVDTEEFKTLPFDLLQKLILSADLNVESENQVYEAVMKWVKMDTEKRKSHLGKLMSQVKLPLLTPSYLLQTVAANELIRRDLECRDYVDDAKAYQMSQASLVSNVRISENSRPRKSYAGVLFCVGGRGASGDPFKSIEVYDPRKNRWFQVNEMNTRRRHVGVCCSAGVLYAIGGHDGSKHLKSGEVFDPVLNTWKTSVKDMSTPRRGIALACLGSAIYAVGGLDDSTCYSLVERYDPSANQWTTVASMNIPRGGVGVCSLRDSIYAVGGNDGIASLNKCEKYDPLLNKWTFISPMNRHRAGAGVAELDGHLYVVGGFDDSSPLDSCESYNPQTNTWTFVTNMSCCRGGVGVASLGGKIFAVGGHDGSNYLSSVESYDPIEDRWCYVSSIGLSRAGAGISSSQCTANKLVDLQKLFPLDTCAGNEKDKEIPHP